MPKDIYAGQGLSYLGGTESSLPAGYALGDVRWSDDGNKKYRLFYNAGGASIPTGYVFQRSYGGTGLYSVTVTTTTETGCTAAAGMNEGLKTITTGVYFWGAVFGRPFGLVSATQSVATDGVVTMEGTSGGGKVTGTAVSFNVIGVNLGDYASTVTGLATAMTGIAGGRFFIAFEDRPAWFTNKCAH